jgi:tryptophan 6-halogenase
MRLSWYSLMSGMGIFPDSPTLRAPEQEARYKMTAIDNLLQRSALNFRKHREVLADIPRRSRDDSLQIYFW